MGENNRQQGFSLFEMIVVLAIVGIITMYNVTKLTQEIQSKINIKAGEEVGYFTERLFDLVNSGLLDGRGNTFNNFEFIKLNSCDGNTLNGIDVGEIGVLDPDVRFERDRAVECGFQLETANGATFFNNPNIVVLDPLTGIVSINLDLRPILLGPEPTMDIINMLDGLDLYLARRGLSLGLGTDIQVLPATLNQITAMIDEFNADPTDLPIMTVSMNMRLTIELLSDGTRMLNDDASLCWNMGASGNVCLLPTVNGDGSATLSLVNGRTTDPIHLAIQGGGSIDLSSGGTLITQKSVVNGATNARIASTPVANYLVMSDDNIQKPICPGGLTPRIATALSAITSSNRATPTDWGDDNSSAPAYGESGYLGIAGSGWETIVMDDVEFWSMESFVAATGLDSLESDETNSRIMVSVWCEE